MYNIYEGMDMKGTVLRLEKSSIFDGDGLRTVVFLKAVPSDAAGVPHRRVSRNRFRQLLMEVLPMDRL